MNSNKQIDNEKKFGNFETTNYGRKYFLEINFKNEWKT